MTQAVLSVRRFTSGVLALSGLLSLGSGGGRAVAADQPRQNPASAAGAARLEPDAHSLLAGADEIRNPAGDFAATITLLEYRNKKLADASTVKVYVKQGGESGQANNLVRFVAPNREAGKLVLRNGLEVWFYDPASKASIRLSPQARLLGLASVSDVMSTSFARSYKAKITAREVTEDDAKQPRNAVKLRLTAERQDVAYAHVDYWIDEGTNRPIKAQFFTDEGRLLKSAFFRRYQPVLGRDRPTETVIIDGLDARWITVVRQLDVRSSEVPRNWFQRGNLPHIHWAE
jgi:outer membrane lipoprotein-sorting protein